MVAEVVPFSSPPITSILTNRSQYQRLLNGLLDLPEELQIARIRTLATNDLFFLLVYVLGRKDADRDWLFDRCREVQASPNGHLDLWARESYKSTIITFALTIQNVLVNPELTVGIFSHTRPIAKGFLRQIKREFEGNEQLKRLFPEIIWDNPGKDAPKWSEDDGLVLKRQGNPKESTIEAWGLVDGQPTSKHFSLMVYDDVVTVEGVSGPDMISKITERWELSRNLSAEGGRTRYIGTRYHFNDTWAAIMNRGAAKPRIYAATVDGTVDGEPVLLTQERLAEKRREMGPYTFACFTAGTRVLMADWTERDISEVKVGESVVGYRFGDGGRARLVRSCVLAVQRREQPVVRFLFESGREVIGTRDHKFWHGRSKRDYSPLGFGYGELKAACSVYDAQNCTDPAEFAPMAAGYLAGIFDGEGCVSGNAYHIAQSHTHNADVCDKIEWALNECGFAYSRYEPRPGQYDYCLTGGREAKIRFARLMGRFGKAERVIEAIFANGTRNIGKACRDKLESIDDMGAATVYNIQTETGNYVANGYAVKNCQMLQDPKADETQGFLETWLRFYQDEAGWESMNRYIVVDPASEKRRTSDYTAVWVVGLSLDGNLYVLDMYRDRLNLTQRADLLFRLHRKWRPKGIGYEKYGMMADIEHIKDRQSRENYRFEITELGGSQPKNDRIRRLIPLFEQGRVWLPETMHRTDYEGVTKELVTTFVEEEYKAFPVGLHDDMLDALARILDETLSTIWPREYPDDTPDRYSKGKRRSQSWMTA